MAEVCVDRNLKIAAGVLGIEKWSTPRLVVDQSFNSVGDGTLAVNTTLPGKLMIDSGVLSWASDSPLDSNILIRVGRGYRDLLTSNPNAIQVRDRWTTKVGTASPQDPNPSTVFQSQWGAAMDIGTTNAALPYAGRYWLASDAQITEDWYPALHPGETLKIWYKCYAWTPPPFSNNANNNSLQMTVNVRSARIQLWSFPVQDTDVVTG